MPDPDWIYDPDNWETTYDWGDRDDLAEGLCGDDIMECHTLVQGPSKFCAMIGVGDRDENGDFDDFEVQWFDSKEEAKKALQGVGPW